MKKIININLSGRVIPIEDAAYESLQRYIDSLRRYFAHEEGRDEIINDIESRMAELMDNKIKTGAAAVTERDIEEIIASMGRIEDFEQVDAATDPGTTSFTEETSTTRRGRGRLYRNANDKILGGVSSGIADYLQIDPAIVRILFVLLALGGGASILLYIVLWIVVPISHKPPVRQRVKRLFRNPDDRVLFGVAGGIGAYFNKDAWVIRLIFAAPLLLNIIFGILNGLFFAFDGNVFPSFFIGSFTMTFVIAYIVLAVIMPEAKTPYQKMEMRGEDVDVNRIRENVKAEMQDFKTRAQSFGQEVKETAQNFGQRAKEFAGSGRQFANEAGQAVRPAASGLGYVIGLLFKIFFLCIAGFIAFIFFTVLLVFFFSGAGDLARNFLLEGFTQKFLGIATAILLFGIPLIALITYIVRRIMRVRTHNRYLGWTFGGLWTIGIFMAIAFAATMVKSFRYNEKVEQPATTVSASHMLVKVSQPAVQYTGTLGFIHPDDNEEIGWDVTADTLKMSNVKLRIDKSEDSLYHVTVTKYGAGSSRLQARNRAEKLSYTASVMDSVLDLASHYTISKEDKFRAQRVIVEILVPVGKKIQFDQSVEDKLSHMNIRMREERRSYRYGRNRDHDWDFDSYFDWTPGVVYVMSNNGELVTEGSPVTPPTPAAPGRTYEYKRSSVDSLKESIEEKKRQLEEEVKKLERIGDDRTGLIQSRSNMSMASIQSPVISILF